MSRAKISLFACLFITASLILFNANGNIEVKVSEKKVKSVEKVVDQEIIEDFELKTWNRSKSIGFLRKSSSD